MPLALQSAAGALTVMTKKLHTHAHTEEKGLITGSKRHKEY